MAPWGLVLLILCIVTLGLQLAWALRFALCYHTRPPASNSPPYLPTATVFLCVRGADPSLIACLDSLLEQDYPNYDVCIVVDSDDDPAWDALSPVLERTDRRRFNVQILQERRETCSLKLSGLVQAIGKMQKTIQVVVLIDSDVIAYRSWLHDLVQPLADASVGATTGVRWYVPRGKSSLGTLVRSLWNAGACAQMYALGIPWGGSMAFRAEIFRDSDLLDRWAQSFVEDTASPGHLRRIGLSVRYVPLATMVNHETVSLRDSFQFIRRQLIAARYHQAWPMVLAIGIATPLALAAALSVIFLGRDPALGASLAATVAIYVIGLAGALSWADRQINRLAQSRGAACYPYSWRSLPALPLTQITHLVSLASATFLRHIEWRGIPYRLERAGRVRLLEYRPYRRSGREAVANDSLV